MERLNQYNILLFCFVVISGLVSFALCLAAEFKKPKRSDLRFDGKLCYLPGTSAFGLGVAALVCLCTAQITGNLFVCLKFRSKERCCSGNVKSSVSCSLLIFSWICFGLSVFLTSGATSMCLSQAYGEGWLDEECYLVKDGVFVGSAVLSLLALGSTLGSGAIKVRRGQAGEKIRFTHK